ncbi:hypothetical protein E2C01_008533 [Portunus trituberculatus]|uniref:Uncharacterized protein n=1 Tax=Portunus trituberculatus TaxID=210409 RepID=A0A5B7D114_PORTR|nr:hypothetical protein [Portunus trituberculatus]
MTRPSGSRGATPDQLAPEGVVADLFSTVVGRASGEGSMSALVSDLIYIVRRVSGNLSESPLAINRKRDRCGGYRRGPPITITCHSLRFHHRKPRRHTGRHKASPKSYIPFEERRSLDHAPPSPLSPPTVTHYKR